MGYFFFAPVDEVMLDDARYRKLVGRTLLNRSLFGGSSSLVDMAACVPDTQARVYTGNVEDSGIYALWKHERDTHIH